MIEKIAPEKIKELSISSLPTYPNTPASAGGAGYSSADIKQAFDALTLYVIEKYNDLVDAIKAEGEGSITEEIHTGLGAGHTLSKLLNDIFSGSFAIYMRVNGTSLTTVLNRLDARLRKVEEELGL